MLQKLLTLGLIALAGGLIFYALGTQNPSPKEDHLSAFFAYKLQYNKHYQNQ